MINEETVSDFVESSESDDKRRNKVQAQLNQLDSGHHKDEMLTDKKLSLMLPNIETIELTTAAEDLNRVHYKRPRESV